MKRLSKFLFSTFFLIGFYHVPFAQKKQPDETYKNLWQIMPTDSKADIISKAVHTIPTPNQYAALQNEFFGFICLGPNTFTRVEWEAEPKILQCLI